MSKTVIVVADELIGCPKRGYGFALSAGISRPVIERHADEHERVLIVEKKRPKAEFAAEAKRLAERDAAAAREEFQLGMKSAGEALVSRDTAAEKFRADELALRRQLRELENKAKNRARARRDRSTGMIAA